MPYEPQDPGQVYFQMTRIPNYEGSWGDMTNEEFYMRTAQELLECIQTPPCSVCEQRFHSDFAYAHDYQPMDTEKLYTYVLRRWTDRSGGDPMNPRQWKGEEKSDG